MSTDPGATGERHRLRHSCDLGKQELTGGHRRLQAEAVHRVLQVDVVASGAFEDGGDPAASTYLMNLGDLIGRRIGAITNGNASSLIVLIASPLPMRFTPYHKFTKECCWEVVLPRVMEDSSSP